MLKVSETYTETYTETDVFKLNLILLIIRSSCLQKESQSDSCSTHLSSLFRLDLQIFLSIGFDFDFEVFNLVFQVLTIFVVINSINHRCHQTIHQ